jgi:TMEM175 potassium channel family protein
MQDTMGTTRVEAFSDGVIAILITIMVLELKVPDGSDWESLRHASHKLLPYILSFVFLGIYWNNHHHMLHVCERVNGKVLWANLHLLFWLSLVPFTTDWVGEHPKAPLPAAIYGTVLLLAGVAYLILERMLIGVHGPDSRLSNAVGGDLKGTLSAILYAAAIPLAFVNAWIAHAIYVGVALMWLVPDKRIESTVG